jgi:hypothetical protein
MPRIRSVVALFVLALSAAACASVDDDGDPVRVRVANASDRTFASVRVLFPDEIVDYGSLAPGQESAYRTVGTAYSYAGFEVEVGGDTLRMQPIDYVGETPLAAGAYTYVLDLDEGDPTRLSLTLRTDPG